MRRGPLVLLVVLCVCLSAADTRVGAVPQSPARAHNSISKPRNRRVDIELFDAAQSGNAGRVSALLSKGHSANARDAYGELVLSRSIEFGRRTVVNVLLKHGANVNATGQVGSSPMMRAAARSDMPTMRRLVAAGADVRAKDRLGVSVLGYAARWGSAETLRWLLSQGADGKNDRSARLLFWGAMNNDVGKLEVSREIGIDLNSPVSSFGETPLGVAAGHGHTEAAKWLLAHGASVDGKDREGQTPLMRALVVGWGGAVRVLIGHGADVNARDSRGNTVLMHLASPVMSAVCDPTASRADVARILLGYGADPTAKDPLGKTALDRLGPYKTELRPVLEEAIRRKLVR